MTAQTPGAAGTPGGDQPPIKEQAKHAAGTATDEGKRVAGVAADEVRQVAEEARTQARDLLGELRTQVNDQGRTQRDRIVQALADLTDELDEMADAGGRSGVGTEVVRQVSARAKDLRTALDGKEPGDVLADVRRMARRRPGTFLLGALAAGVLAGRITRGATSGGDDGSASTPTPDTTGTPVQPTYGATSAYGSPTTGAAGPDQTLPPAAPPVTSPPSGAPASDPLRPSTPNLSDPVEPGLSPTPGEAPGYRPGPGGGTP